MSCPVIKDSRVIEALKVGREMVEFMKCLKCPKAKEIVSKWETLARDCPKLQDCKNNECPCGDNCDCLARNVIVKLQVQQNK